MTNIPSAGTADRASATFPFIAHKYEDMDTYDLAKNLDEKSGNESFKYRHMYYEVRPIIKE